MTLWLFTALRLRCIADSLRLLYTRLLVVVDLPFVLIYVVTLVVVPTFDCCYTFVDVDSLFPRPHPASRDRVIGGYRPVDLLLVASHSPTSYVVTPFALLLHLQLLLYTLFVNVVGCWLFRFVPTRCSVPTLFINPVPDALLVCWPAGPITTLPTRLTHTQLRFCLRLQHSPLIYGLVGRTVPGCARTFCYG